MTENENVSSFCCESCRKKKKRVQWHRNERKRWQGEEDDAEHVQKNFVSLFYCRRFDVCRVQLYLLMNVREAGAA